MDGSKHPSQMPASLAAALSMTRQHQGHCTDLFMWDFVSNHRDNMISVSEGPNYVITKMRNLDSLIFRLSFVLKDLFYFY